MRLSIKVPIANKSALEGSLVSLVSDLSSSDSSEKEVTMTCLVEPGKFRTVTELVTKSTKGSGSVQVTSLKE